MLFQTFDKKKDCLMIYKGSEFQENVDPSCTQTWTYANFLKDYDIDYAKIFVQGKNFNEACPEELKEELESIETKVKAFLNSAIISGLSLKDVCFYDLIPEHVLKSWAKLKDATCKHVFDNHSKPANYSSLLNVEKMISEIEFQPLKLDIEENDKITVQDKNTYNLLKKCEKHIIYDQFRTATGRLSTKSNSFPIMTLAKKYRGALKPTNDWLFEIDFNACELRVALALLGKEQPEEDLHHWNLVNAFPRSKDREYAKRLIFAWLYNPKSESTRFSEIYNRDKIKNLHFKDNLVETVYNRKIDCDEDHAVNYIVQSTAADLVFEQMYKVWKLLEGRKSFIKFCNHDSIMIDFSEDDQLITNDIKELFCNTRFGKFKVNCSAGKNWHDMQKLNIK